MNDIRISQLTEWLGAEGAVVGLEKSFMTNADLMMLARKNGLDVEKKTARKQLAVEIVMSNIKRVEKTHDDLQKMSIDELKRYFTERLVSSNELMRILSDLGIAPTRKIRGKLVDFAANEISDLGMYQRVARGRPHSGSSKNPS